jgi:hypothetical protein
MIALVCLVAAATASADASAAPPVRPSVRLSLPDAFVVHGQAVTVPGRALHIDGVITPYVPDQQVSVEVWLGGRLVKAASPPLARSANGRYGRFSQTFDSPGVGGLRVEVTHAATPEMAQFTSTRTLTSLDERVGFGSTGTFVTLIQQRLAALHFYISQTGVYDEGTGLAIDAYHRLLRRGTSRNLDSLTIGALLDGLGEFHVRFPGHGRHAEGNLSLQLLALVNGSQVEDIFPISSGKPSTPTILGSHRIYSRVPGYLPDGMYYSNFFLRGYAIHGYDPAPDYPASHGCMRLPIVDAVPAFNWLALGDWVDVYH